MKPLEKILDVAVQKLSEGKKCHYCQTEYGVVIHHLVHRDDKLYRYDKRNFLPVCIKHHGMIHFECLKQPDTPFKCDNIKSYLLRHGMTYNEFLTDKMKEFDLPIPRQNKKPVAHKMTSTEKPVIRKNRNTEKYNENWRKNQKELYRKKKEWLKNKKYMEAG